MFIGSTNSTNTLLKELLAKGEWQEGERFIRAGYQSAGRGQTGNGWESESNKNLLCSILLPTRKNLFELNVITAVAVHKAISELGISELAIKWPNDIYWQDKKVAGILVENAIVGSEVKYSIAGIGLNVNQTEWHSDAPNPISLKQIYGKDFDVRTLMECLLQEIDKVLEEDVWDYYLAHLYRKEGFWPFVERDVSTAPTMNADKAAEKQFLARIKDVLPTGEILLEDQEGQQRKYHFKQIQYVI